MYLFKASLSNAEIKKDCIATDELVAYFDYSNGAAAIIIEASNGDDLAIIDISECDIRNLIDLLPCVLRNHIDYWKPTNP